MARRMLVAVALASAGLIVAAAQGANTPEILWTFEAGG
jgi:hypothetical protein